jgi:para-nitrobenzyl esterase
MKTNRPSVSPLVAALARSGLVFAALLGFVGLTALFLAATASSCKAQGGPPHVRIDAGPLIGTANDQVVVFKGIPYAAPPVGDLRWRPPIAPKPWTEALQALDYGFSCPQEGPIRFVAPSSRAASTREDCLTLNVWAPAKAAGAPVLVWIHGGGNTEGTASQQFYDGSAFARDGVVVVSMNYRLGLLGFFAHPVLGAGPANFGLMDQIAALQWVKRNARAFGGDPDQVTVMGESAGGQDILALMASPTARGLFVRAIVESPGGGWDRYPTLAEAQANGARLKAATGAELRAMTPDALLKAVDEDAIGPILDGVVLKEGPIQALAAGHMPALPLLIGTNSDEGSLLWPQATLTGLDKRITPEKAAGLARLYGETDSHALAKLVFRDGYFASPVRWIAGRWPAPAYVYRFDYVAETLRARRPGASHGSEVPFVFATADFAHAPDDLKVAALMHDCWTAFAKGGAPSCAQAPGWAPFKAADDRLMRLDAPPEWTVNPAHVYLNILDAATGTPPGP